MVGVAASIMMAVQPCFAVEFLEDDVSTYTTQSQVPSYLIHLLACFFHIINCLTFSHEMYLQLEYLLQQQGIVKKAEVNSPHRMGDIAPMHIHETDNSLASYTLGALLILLTPYILR